MREKERKRERERGGKEERERVWHMRLSSRDRVEGVNAE